MVKKNTVDDKTWKRTLQGIGADIAARSAEGAREKHRQIQREQKAAKEGQN
jgi:hypothetical protein